jgi:hypothetical protein
MSGFEADQLDELRAARTIRIETSRGPDRPVHETIIWVVVDEADRVFVRSEYGERGRWFRELLANPSGAVQVGSRRIPVRAEHAADPDRVAACSRGLSTKYKTSRGSLAMMLRDEIIGSTLELHRVVDR